jgi:hypothetical protein
MRNYLMFVLFFYTALISAQNVPGLPPTLFPSIVSPAQPTTNQDVFLGITVERCIGLQGSVPDFPPVARDGVIIVQIPGSVEIDSMFCFSPRFSPRITLGKFPPGAYTIELRIRPGFFPVTEPGLIVQRTPLVVGPAPFTVEQVPGTRPIGLAVLALGLVLLGSIFVRRVG